MAFFHISQKDSTHEQFIRLSKEELDDSLQEYLTELTLSRWKNSIVIDETCKLLNLIHVFRGKDKQEEKLKSVCDVLKEWLKALPEETRHKIFETYISQQLEKKSFLTEEDLLTKQIDPYHEFQLKLCYFATLHDEKAYTEFLVKNEEFFVSEAKLHKNKTNLKPISCKLLLCYLSLNQSTSGKIKKVRSLVQTILSTLSDHVTSTLFEEYLEHMYAIKSKITDTDLCTGKIEPNFEFKLKLCYCQRLSNKNDNEALREFLKTNADFLVLQIEGIVHGNLTQNTTISCKILLCLLSWNICRKKTALNPLNSDNCKQLTANSKKNTIKYTYAASKVRKLLQKLLSTLNDNDISELFNIYFLQMYGIKTNIHPHDWQTSKKKIHYELQLKLCYSEKLCYKEDKEALKEFLRRNAEFLVSEIEGIIHGNETRTKFISCQILLYFLKWDICDQKTTHNLLKQLLDFLTQKTKTNQQEVSNKFMNENALLFISTAEVVMTRNYIPVLNKLCDVLLCIPYNELHYDDVTRAVNKLVRYYATQVEISGKTCEWILRLGCRPFMYIKHMKDMNQHAIKKIQHDLHEFIMFLDELFTKTVHHRKTFDLFFNTLRKKKYLENENKDHGSETFETQFSTKNQHLKELWIAKITIKVKTIQISHNNGKISRDLNFEIYENQKSKENGYDFDIARSQDNFIDVFEAEVKEDQLKAKTIEDQIKANIIIDEMVKKTKLSEMLVLLMMLLIVGTSSGHHKSAKLKKYLTLKYEYDEASLYLLWCSGDIEVHPGPCLKKKSLIHDSSIERRWIQNVSLNIIILSKGVQPKLGKRKNDKECRDYFKVLLKSCQEEVGLKVPKMYLAEIKAWETMEYKLLNELFIYRCEIQTVKSSICDFLTYGGDVKAFKDINVNFIAKLNKKEFEEVFLKDQMNKDKPQTLVIITRNIASIIIKCAHGKDPNKKCDGLWDLPLKNWPRDIILFDPNNRGKYSKKFPGQKLISDQELVEILITLPQVTIPKKYKDIVEAFRTMRKSKIEKDKSINKQHKAELCTTFKRIISLEKLKYALKNLWENGILTEVVHNNLIKWWTIGAVDTTHDQKISQVDIKDADKKRRPHISINISTKSITLTVEQTCANSSQVSYDFPFNDELVPLKTMGTTVCQTTVQKPLKNDSHQKITAEKYLTVSPKLDACPADNQTNSIIFPPEALTVLNTYFPCHLYPTSHAILESEIKHQHKMSSQETTICSTNYFDQQTFSTNQFSQLNQTIAISGQPGPILCTHNQSTTNSDDISSATKDSQNPDFHMQVSPTSDMGLSNSLSSVNSESGNEDGDQNNMLNGCKVLLTDSDYSLDSRYNCLSTNMKKRKCTEEEKKEMKKRRKTSPKQGKEQIENNHRKTSASTDTSTIFNTNMELLLEGFNINIDSFELNDIYIDDKNQQNSDKAGRSLMKDCTQISYENKNASAYNTKVSTELNKFIQDMLNGEV